MANPNSKRRNLKAQTRRLAFGILFFASFATAQFSFVNSRAGFAEIRSDRSANSRLVAKLPNGSMMYAFEDETENGWISVDAGSGNEVLTGYARISDIVPISKLIPVLYSYSNEHKIILANNDIRIILTEADFDPGTAKLEFDPKQPNILLHIDGEPFYGTDGGIPKKRYGFIDVAFGTQKVEIPAVATKSLYQPNLESTQAFYDDKNDVLYIASSNSDGAGGYEVLWVIEKKRYKNRHVFYGF